MTVEKKFPATVRVYFDNVNSESYQTFLEPIPVM